MESIVINKKHTDYCFFCGSYKTNGEHHLIFGSNRTKAEEDGLKVPVCDKCHMLGNATEKIHDNPMAEKLSKMLGQAIYEKNECEKGITANEAREKFRKRYGQSYL